MTRVLLDLSVLRTEARVRGIGRYVADLALGIARGARSTNDLQVLGVEQIDWLGSAVISSDLERSLRTLSEAPEEDHLKWAYRLRLGLARASRRVRPDLVHTGHPNATPLGHFGCPRVTTCHDLIPLRYPDRYLDHRDGYRIGRRLLDHRRYHSADHVIAVSESSARDLVEMLGVSPGKITVVHNGVDLARWSAEVLPTDASVRARHGLADRPYLLYVGGGDWRKNADGMFRAIAAVRAAQPSLGLTLAWAAELDPGTRARLLAQADELGARDGLHLLGFVPDAELAALYRGAVAQLFVSRAEGFGYPLVEAMAAGCPAITSDRSSMAELAGDAALLVDPENVAAIAQAIRTFANDGAERQRFAARGRQRAACFSLERMAEHTLDVYRRVIATGR